MNLLGAAAVCARAKAAPIVSDRATVLLQWQQPGAEGIMQRHEAAGLRANLVRDDLDEPAHEINILPAQQCQF